VANSFTITINAVDKATATVRKVNDAIGQLTRPFEDVGKSFKSLGRELGFEKIGKNLGNIGQQAGSAARSIGSIVAPMAAITGIGSIAGIASLASHWANLGRSIDNSSRGIGISSGQLQGFQGAAKMLGVDAGVTTASLDGLADTMQNAQWGRNQGALMMFNRLGIGLKKTKDGAWDVVGEYKAIADAVAKETDPRKQKVIAGAFGLEGMLPFLREGSAGIERYEAMVTRLGFVMGDDAVKRGKEFSISLAGLGIAVDGVKNSIGDKLIPVMKPLIDQFSVWLATNRELIATDIGKWAEGFAKWINSINWTKVGDGIVKFGEGIGKVVGWLGGWENAALLVVGVMNAGLIVSVVSLGGSLLRAGVGIVAFTGLLSGWKVAAIEAGAATEGAAAAAASRGLLGWIGGGVAAAGAGIGSMLYSPTLNDGEDAEVARIRKSQGLPDADTKPTPSLDAASGAWKKLQGVDKGKSAFLMDFFQSKGWSKNNAASMVGNLADENSKFDPQALGDFGRARGLAQWHPDRQKQFEGWAGYKMTDPRADALKQAEFIDWDLTQGKYKSVGDRLRNAKSAEDGAVIFSNGYESPKDDNGDVARRRGQMANQLNLPPLTAAPAGPYAKPADPNGAPGAGGTTGTVKVEIEHKNMPEGTKVNVKSEGNVQASSRISHSGVGSIT
jgi:hypothetical protein